MTEPIKILVIEDNIDWKDIYKGGLKKLGTVLIADTLDKAESLFKKHKATINIIILDGKLGKDNTVELAREIIADEAFEGIVIAASGIPAPGSPDLQKELIEAGCMSPEEYDALSAKSGALMLAKAKAKELQESSKSTKTNPSNSVASPSTENTNRGK
jgi:DNA-binding NtrC family response regulator